MSDPPNINTNSISQKWVFFRVIFMSIMRWIKIGFKEELVANRSLHVFNIRQDADQTTYELWHSRKSQNKNLRRKCFDSHGQECFLKFRKNYRRSYWERYWDCTIRCGREFSFEGMNWTPSQKTFSNIHVLWSILRASNPADRLLSIAQKTGFCEWFHNWEQFVDEFN